MKAPYANYIQEYYHRILAGDIIVGEWIRRLYEKITAGLRDGLFYFDARKADRAIDFIETFCHHCEGRSDLITLELWQKATVCLMFGIVDEDGLRIFREVFLVMGRKNGKSLFASACIAYMVYLDGEYGAKVYCLAPKLEQAAIVYDNFYKMVQREPELSGLAMKRRSDVYLESTNASIRPLAFNAKKSDGFNPHLTVCDEIASWPAEQGRKQYEVMKSALGARKQPMILSISTAGYVNDGPYDELMVRSTAWLLGNSKERRLLPILYIIDNIAKWNDVDELQERESVPYRLYVQQGLIQPSGENFVDYRDCFAWFKMLVEEYEILPLQVGYDRYSSQYLVQEMQQYGFHMDDVFQGWNLSPVMMEADGLLRDKTLLLGNNNLLKSHFLNTAVKQNDENRKLQPVKIEARCHIDGFVAVIDALTVRQKWYDAIGEQLKNE